MSLHNLFRNSEIFSDNLTDFSNSPIFIKPSKEQRGTVSSSIIMVSLDGSVKFVEKSWTPSEKLSSQSELSFVIMKDSD
jgi:uncharacterized protein with NRDE domain